MRPYNLPRELISTIVIAVYIPPSADAAVACEVISSTAAKLQTDHPDAFMVITGDFNHGSLDKTLNNFHQYVDCPTRDNKTLDLLYANAMDAYDATALPPLGRSDHNLVMMTPSPDCALLLQQQALDYQRILKALLNKKKRAFRAGDREKQRRVQHELRDMLRTCKDNYRRKLEAKLQQNNVRDVWTGMKHITGMKGKDRQTSGSLDRANQFNQFFNRFSSPPASLPYDTSGPITTHPHCPRWLARPTPQHFPVQHLSICPPLLLPTPSPSSTEDIRINPCPTVTTGQVKKAAGKTTPAKGLQALMASHPGS
ncbi:hypothetical protein L3Q82_009273 [Scortum barcoo]|uniref:Uncharacterized protein n=1 Tax=Scortum barcoo TaxID=214431 RepID=A0ACB8WH78_9TELE|nr:hypothetical protein L3Q82_009273 [Scortum barcoo]